MSPDLRGWSAPTPLDAYARAPFPVHALPKWLEQFVSELGEETQTPLDLAGMLALAVLATTCAKRAVVQIGPNWTEPLSLWVAAALSSGNRKTAVLTRMVSPLVHFEEEWARGTRTALAIARSERRTMEEQLKRVEALLAKSEGLGDDELRTQRDRLAGCLDAMLAAVSPRLVVEDITPESLASVLAEQGGRIALLSDEGGPFDIMAGRYSKNGIPNLDVYLKGDSASDLRVDRRGRPSEHVHSPALTLGLTVQPDVIRGLAGRPGFRGRGLLARFLFSWPMDLVGMRKVNGAAVSAATEAAYTERVLKLLAGAERVKDEPEYAPVVLTIGQHGKRVLYEFAGWLEPQLAEHGSLGFVADWGNKLTGKVARIAGLFHVAEFGSLEAAARSSVDVETVSAATEFGRYLIEHAKAVFTEMGADPERGEARLILNWVRSRDLRRFSKREAFNALRSRFKRVEQLAAPLQLLADHGYLREIPGEGQGGPGRPPSPAFEVNPHVHAQNAQNSQKVSFANTAVSARGGSGQAGGHVNA